MTLITILITASHTKAHPVLSCVEQFCRLSCLSEEQLLQGQSGILVWTYDNNGRITLHGLLLPKEH